MRVLSMTALTLVVGATAAFAQVPDSTPAGSITSRQRAEIAIIRRLFGSVQAPPADSFRAGAYSVGTGAESEGTVAIAGGNLDVRGTVNGHAIALHGDVIVHPGGRVAGNAIAIDGRVRTLGGVVEGDVRAIRGVTAGILSRAGATAGVAQPRTTWEAVKLVIGWFTVLFAVGIGVLLFAERNLDEVVTTLQNNFGRSFFAGFFAQVAALPALLLICAALAISLIGILLIPFAIVAFIVALAGLCALGFIAVSRFTGRVFFRSAPSTRAVHLRSLFVGLLVYMAFWFLAAVFRWNPVIGSVLHSVALAGSWVVLTFGLGATVLTRAGTRREAKPAARTVDDMAWQTPTPVTGVVAARRPVVTSKES